MKIRTGFVSNSSSSSFIVSFKKKEDMYIKIPLDRFENKIISSEQELLDHINDLECTKLKLISDIPEEYQDLADEIKAGRKIFIGSIDWSEDGFDISDVKNNKKLKIIREDD